MIAGKNLCDKCTNRQAIHCKSEIAGGGGFLNEELAPDTQVGYNDDYMQLCEECFDKEITDPAHRKTWQNVERGSNLTIRLAMYAYTTWLDPSVTNIPPD